MTYNTCASKPPLPPPCISSAHFYWKLDPQQGPSTRISSCYHLTIEVGCVIFRGCIVELSTNHVVTCLYLRGKRSGKLILKILFVKKRLGHSNLVTLAFHYCFSMECILSSPIFTPKFTLALHVPYLYTFISSEESNTRYTLHLWTPCQHAHTHFGVWGGIPRQGKKMTTFQ